MMHRMIDQASGCMVTKMDDEIRSALNHFWPVWSADDVKRRCQLVRVAGSPIETLCADGVPLIEIGPVQIHTELSRDTYVVRLTRTIRRVAR